MAFVRKGDVLRHLSVSHRRLFHIRPLCKQWLRPSSSADTRYDGKGYQSNRLQNRLNDKANTVIIGGGALGTSTAYHLAKAGMKNVILLEKSELTAGATWHAAGLATFYQPNINMKRITHASLKLYRQIEEETGQEVGFHRPGTIRLAKTPERVDEFRYHMQRNGWHTNIPQRIIGPEEIKKLHPLLNTDKILAGLYFEGDGHIDPYSLTQAYAAGARKYGAEIYQNAPVLGLKQTNDGKWEVKTQHGTITANRIVNATGFWSREVGEMVGIEVPMMAMQHQYIVTSSIPEVNGLSRELPVLRDLEGSYYVRQERTGLLVGPYENQDNLKQQTEWLKGVPPGFGRELFESDLDRISEHLEVAMETIPVLQTADIQTVICGPLPYSPDALGMAGPYPGLSNYWILNGCSGGIVWSGGLGKYLTDWIMGGEPPHDLFDLDPARYGKWLTKDYLIAKTKETYSMNNALRYPFEERYAGRPTYRVSGAYEKMKERGAEFGFNSGWEQPKWFALPGDEKGNNPSFQRTNWFGPVGRECNMVMERAGVIDLSSVGKFEVQGEDASSLLDYLTAAELPKVGHHKTVYMLTPSGKIYAEITVCRLSNNHYFCVNSAAAELHDIRWIENHAFNGGYKVNVINITDDKACLGIAGPKSRQILQELTDTNLSDVAFPSTSTKLMNIAGVDTFVIRGSSTGELGYALYHCRGRTSELYTALLSAGDPYGIGDFGTYAANILRIEKGYRSWGRELTVDYNPYETGVEEDLNIDKEVDFIGKAVLPSLRDTLGRRLTLLSVECSHNNIDPMGYETVWYNGQAVGNTTSGGYSYTTNQSIAYAFLPIHIASIGSRVQIEMMGKCYTGTVIPDPLLLSEKKLLEAREDDDEFSSDDDDHSIKIRKL
ncbi:dimethylglycine dehydrogenase, mitochondrial-like [Glandiceps talaboti]